MNDTLQHHELTAEWINDGQGRAVMLTQQDGSGCNEASTIVLSPWQLREVCERFALIGSSDAQAEKTIATLTRRIQSLRTRIDHMAYWLANHADNKHADLSYEQTYSTATADIADEFCAELEAVQASTEATRPPPERVNPSIGTDTRQMSIDA